jgi:RimJ/RimL family protein N-acetyltransferase
MSELRALVAGDQSEVERFLWEHVDSSMIMLSNCLAHGLEYSGQPRQGTYVGAFEQGKLIGLVAHYWNGMLFLQAPREAAELSRAAIATSGRAFTGAGGSWSQVQQALEALGQTQAVHLNKREVLFSLELNQLRVPSLLSSGEVRCRSPREEELVQLVAWREAYSVEILGEKPGPKLHEQSQREMARAQAEASHWVLEHQGRIVATTGFNARVPGVVQVGGVYTPPELRSRGFARAAVAGSLIEAEQKQGARRSILFTGEEQHAAQRAYLALGFRQIGDFGLAFTAS